MCGNYCLSKIAQKKKCKHLTKTEQYLKRGMGISILKYLPVEGGVEKGHAV